MRTLARLVAFGIVAVALAGCGGSKPKDKIIGKWQGVEKEGGLEIKYTMEFAKDGTAKLNLGEGDKSITLNAKYTFVDDNTFDIEPEGGKGKKERTKIEEITADKLVVSGEGGKKKELTKVK